MRRHDSPEFQAAQIVILRVLPKDLASRVWDQILALPAARVPRSTAQDDSGPVTLQSYWPAALHSPSIQVNRQQRHIGRGDAADAKGLSQRARSEL